MRRLLLAIVTLGVLIVFTAPAMAAGRVPKGVTKVSFTLTFPLQQQPTARKPENKTITNAASVARIVTATNGLQPVTNPGVCPMVMRISDELTVVFRNAKGVMLAEATAAVALGSSGTDGSSPCDPIRFTSGTKGADVLGNSWIRLMGRMIGTAIS